MWVTLYGPVSAGEWRGELLVTVASDSEWRGLSPGFDSLTANTDTESGANSATNVSRCEPARRRPPAPSNTASHWEAVTAPSPPVTVTCAADTSSVTVSRRRWARLLKSATRRGVSGLSCNTGLSGRRSAEGRRSEGSQ